MSTGVSSGISESHFRRHRVRSRDIESQGTAQIPIEVSVTRVQEDDIEVSDFSRDKYVGTPTTMSWKDDYPPDKI